MIGRKLWASELLVTGIGSIQCRAAVRVCARSRPGSRAPIVRLSTIREGRAWSKVMPPLVKVGAPWPACTTRYSLPAQPHPSGRR